MDYLKYRGCNVNMIQRYVAHQAPLPKPDRDLSQCKEEDEFKLGPHDYEESTHSQKESAGSRTPNLYKSTTTQPKKTTNGERRRAA